MTDYQSEMSPEFRERLKDYLAARDQERKDAVIRMWNNLDEREQKLVREAAVMGFVQGVQACGGLDRERFPKDDQIVTIVLTSVRDHQDLYPTLSELEAP